MSEGQAGAAGEAGGKAWGDAIEEGRKQALWGRLRAWWEEAEHGERVGPFAEERLTGAEAFWLAVCAVAKDEASTVEEAEGRLRDERSRGFLSLSRLCLNGADLGAAELQGADLREAQLQGADLFEAELQGADLRRASLDGKTRLAGVALCTSVPWWRRALPFVRGKGYGLALGDITWNGVGTVDLTQVADWDGVERLGDERFVSWQDGANAHQAVTRAYRQVAAQLRAQGMSEVADRLSHRALSYERRVFWRRGNIPRYLGSWLLAVLAGYGYRPLYTIFWYLVVIGGFAFGYIEATHGLLTFGLAPSQVQPLKWYEALILSVSAFHGRGFFQPVQSLGDPVAILAALEAIIGLMIEISFIATFTQRFFGAR